MTRIVNLLVGQSCCSALNSWAARQHGPTYIQSFLPRPA